MKFLKKAALVFCLFAVLLAGLSIFLPTGRAVAAPLTSGGSTPSTTTPSTTTTPATTTTGAAATPSTGACSGVATGTPCNPVCGTLDKCLSDATPADSSSCAAGSSTSLEWILCPVVTAASKFADTLNNTVETQLNFNTNAYLADSHTTKCDPSHCQVNKAWLIVKNIVSGLVVILMLVMVISQAVGGQIFDAYTVKKMLPRLAIAVILMQFSWVLSKWAIQSVNDIAYGIKQVMLAPFGGGGQMDLPSILHHINGYYPAVTSFALLGVLLIFVFLFKDFILPLFIFLVVAIGSAVLIALATLVMRNSIIIMAVIFSPLALLLWATPGQTFQGLWRKFADNVGKLLFLFPLIMAMIYAGRIVAWVTGDLTGGTNLMDYLIALIAYFVPYFLLPKSFKWGGQILAAVNQELNSNRAIGMMKNWGYGLSKDAFHEAQGKRASQYTDNSFAQSRFRENSLLAKSLKGVGLGRAIKTKEGAMRQKPFIFNKQRQNLLGAGMVFPSAFNRKKAATKGKEWKHSTDDAWEELDKRAAEMARKGELPGLSVMRGPDGSWKLRAHPWGKNTQPGWDQYFALIQRDLFSKDRRRSERTAQMLATHPEFAIHSNNPIPLDTENKMWKRRQELEKEFGLVRARFACWLKVSKSGKASP